MLSKSLFQIKTGRVASFFELFHYVESFKFFVILLLKKNTAMNTLTQIEIHTMTSKSLVYEI